MADEKRAEKRQAGQEQAADESTIKLVMSSYEGRRWMARVLEFSAMFQSVYRFDGDALGAMFRDGKADVGRFLLGQIDEYAANDYQRLIRERKARNERAAEAEKKHRETEGDEPKFSIVTEDWADRQMAEYEARRFKREQQEQAEE